MIWRNPQIWMSGVASYSPWWCCSPLWECLGSKKPQSCTMLHVISSCAEVFGGYSSVPWLRDAMDFFMVSLAENHLACHHGHILILEECFGLLFCFCLKRMCHWWKNIFSGYKEGGQSNQLILVVLSLVVFVASLHIFALWAYLLLYSFHKSAVLWIRH